MNREQYISILELEKAELKKENKQLKECYCNRTDCNSRIKDSKKYNSVVEERDLYKSIIDELEKYLCQEIDNPFSKYFENDEYIRVVNKIRELKG